MMKRITLFLQGLLLMTLIVTISCSQGQQNQVSSASPETSSPVRSPVIYTTSLPLLGAAPSSCQPPLTQTRTFQQGASDSSSVHNALGGAGVWAVGFGEPEASLYTQYQGKYGYGTKLVWFVDRTQVHTTVVITGVNMQTGKSLVFFLTGEEEKASGELTLDPQTPNHPVSVAGPNWSEWGSEIYYPAAGCYRLTAKWQEGAWSYVIATGNS